MKLTSWVSRVTLGCMAASLLALLAGCAALAPKHRILIDSITSAGAAKPSGQSYRLLLVERGGAGTRYAMAKHLVEACVNSALGTVGMFEAPANAAPDVFITATYGVDGAARSDPHGREAFLQLSGRANPDGALAVTKTAPEIWDVRAGFMSGTTNPVGAMPMLAATAVNYIATDTKVETRVEVAQNAPNVQQIREAAIKRIEAAGNVPAPGATTAGAPPAAAEAPRK
ncbi:MAG TPA: hypothetical protein VGE76_19615, partial [Opitutaceae bacterium]